MYKTPETWVAGEDETHDDGWTYYKTAKIQMPRDERFETNHTSFTCDQYKEHNFKRLKM